MNDPTQFEQVDETCEFGGAVLYYESLGITAFFENAVPSKYETQKLKQLQFGIENEKIRQFEHECLIQLFQWSFLPPGKALDFSVCDEAFGCYKTQYRKRHLLEICQNASFLSTPDKATQKFLFLRVFCVVCFCFSYAVFTESAEVRFTKHSHLAVCNETYQGTRRHYSASDMRFGYINKTP